MGQNKIKAIIRKQIAGSIMCLIILTLTCGCGRSAQAGPKPETLSKYPEASLTKPDTILICRGNKEVTLTPASELYEKLYSEIQQNWWANTVKNNINTYMDAPIYYMHTWEEDSIDVDEVIISFLYSSSFTWISNVTSHKNINISGYAFRPSTAADRGEGEYSLIRDNEYCNSTVYKYIYSPNVYSYALEALNQSTEYK